MTQTQGIGVFSTAIAILFYAIRKKQYHVTWLQIISILLIIGVTGALGANLSSYLTQGTLAGRRAYGVVLGNTVGVFLLSKLWKRHDGSLMDFISIPIFATYVVSKAHCIPYECCYGIVIHITNDGTNILFPSQWFETLCLLAILIWLIILEKKGVQNGFLWAINVLWYGISRYIADLFRGSPQERAPYLLGMPSGQVWSLFDILVGLLLLSFLFKKTYQRKLADKELINAILGKFPIN